MSETSSPNSSDYTLNQQPINPYSADPVHAVIDGPGGINNLFTFQRATRLPLGFASAFMSQRCGKNVEAWDGYCDMYFKQEYNKNFTGKDAHQFIRDTLSQMFCVNDTSVPGSQCVERCEMFDPTTSNSYSVCQTVGDVVYRNNYKVQANDTVFPQTGKLNTTEPIRFTKCPKVCNQLDASKLSDANIPLNIALDQGIALDLITNLVENIVSQNAQTLVTNGRLLKFMNAYVQDGKVKPGLYNIGAGPYVTTQPIAVPAVIPTIPKGKNILVDANRTITGPAMVTDQPVQNVSTPERFGFLDLGENSGKDKNILYAILIISVFAIVVMCLAKNSKK